MANKKLVLDDFFDDEEFTLIGIHSSLEDFRLAYLINKHLQSHLYRKPYDIKSDNLAAHYSIFEWEDQEQLRVWNLVSNTCKVEIQQQPDTRDSLFGTSKTTKTYHLLPEFKRVNYVLKIESELPEQAQKLILNTIQDIKQVVMAHFIDADLLKSKENLIFN
ncbi:IPExxxVDY family protein [Bizionia saleffrena]|uniref:IPExxxVDY family protein n=1 Tax=Bizionia saleffrena TaxID=291189 RepID=A0A8H2LCD1_9FLAO|nr:IPExxxVDY family protein [Bizionia saleffrena]TYB74076.1 IPExxxVDY family protein [Bizionia saleffrena]